MGELYIYPLCFTSNYSGLVVEFDGLTSGEVLFDGTSARGGHGYRIGHYQDEWTPHTNTDTWTKTNCRDIKESIKARLEQETSIALVSHEEPKLAQKPAQKPVREEDIYTDYFEYFYKPEPGSTELLQVWSQKDDLAMYDGKPVMSSGNSIGLYTPFAKQ